MPSTHIEAQIGDIAETVLLPGDPLRAKFIAERYLCDARLFNDVRNMLGYTGHYEGRRVSVMGSGMGMPSVGIYAHELIEHYGVQNLIRIGSAGALQPQLRLRDLVIAQAASTDSNFGSQFGLGGHIAGVPDFALLQRAVRTAEALGLAHHVGHVLSSDFFYHADPENWKKWQKMGVLCVEMEAYALFLTATKLGAKALCITTISDSLVSGENLSQEARQLSFADMARLALALV